MSVNGHKIRKIGHLKWEYKDTGEEVDMENPRPCKLCGAEAGFMQPDPCMGTLPGVAYACCGHGDPRHAYIYFENGVVIRGFGPAEKVKVPERVPGSHGTDWKKQDE